MSSSQISRSAQIYGLGLIGGSIGKALRAAGWHVTGSDPSEHRCAQAMEQGVVDAIGVEGDVVLSFVATPVQHVAGVVRQALQDTKGIVTDVGSVKAPVVTEVDNPRFLGGHPMAGSEQDGLDGADEKMFAGAAWVLTPTANTDPNAFSVVSEVVTGFGADVVSLDPETHDRVVAVVSHVPHLTAAALMGLAADQSNETASVMRLAAGGFPDMTRIAAGHPGIWPDICAQNSTAILEVLDDLMVSLATLRGIISNHESAALLDTLMAAWAARQNLPTTATRPSDLVELRIMVSDRPGQLALVTAIANEQQVNIYDMEIAHSAEGPSGVLILLAAATEAVRYTEGLTDAGFIVSAQGLS